jgi:hypothetical protein
VGLSVEAAFIPIRSRKMLAYIFWHWPRPGTDPQVYESRLARFQDALKTVPISGFRDSAVYRLAGAPWFPPDTAGYQEMYLLDNSCAMDALNDAAVNETCRSAHDQAVEFYAAGAAGLYRLRHGEPSLNQLTHHYWLAKPRGMRYPDFDATVLPALGATPFALWRRQMVLGPTPEFCLQTPAAVKLPSDLTVCDITAEIVSKR